MNVLILQGSFKKNGHTHQLCEPFIDELIRSGADVSEEWICDYDISPCRGCTVCQDKPDELGCVQDDDFAKLYGKLAFADLIVFATPIYIGSAPGHVKSFIDRLCYAPLKIYGEEKRPAPLPGKALAAIITGGAPPKSMMPILEFTLNIVCSRHKWNYLGWMGGTDPGRGYVFMNEKKAQRARDFAAELISKVETM